MTRSANPVEAFVLGTIAGALQGEDHGHAYPQHAEDQLVASIHYRSDMLPARWFRVTVEEITEEGGADAH